VSEFEARLREALELFGVSADDLAVHRMVAHYELMLDWNTRVNLTRMIEPDLAARFHYAESAMCARWLVDAERVIDVGSGAGFPGVPIACLLTDRKVLLVESVRKKCLFLEAAIEALGLDNAAVVNDRFSPKNVRPGDAIVARAVDKFSRLLPALFESEADAILIFGGTDLLDQADSLGRRIVARTPIPGSDRRWLGRFGRFT
jgi:16S rRNA (guanine527-N7)-methyltransferase